MPTCQGHLWIQDFHSGTFEGNSRCRTVGLALRWLKGAVESVVGNLVKASSALCTANRKSIKHNSEWSSVGSGSRTERSGKK